MTPLDLPPLPARCRTALEPLFARCTIPEGANAGLVFQRYAKVWREGFAAPSSQEAREFLQSFVKAFADVERATKPELLSQIKRRKLLAHARWDFTTVDRLAVGLGAEHPTQNGFTFDPILGVPFLPGSTVRGLVRATGKAMGQQADVERLLGTEPRTRGESSGTSRPGRLGFLDAWPIHWPRLEVDIVNPHHPTYYRDLHQWRPGAEGPPNATMVEDPKPAFFLAVAPNITFRFAVRWHRRDQQRAEDEGRIESWLKAGLDMLGAGAKTAAGYGRFKPRDRGDPPG